jgi:LEA14-like dessication related protein
VYNRATKGILGLAALTLVLAACYPIFHPPEVRLAGLRLGSLGLSGGTLHARVLVTNPNRFALAATGLEYDFELSDPGRDNAWIRLADGVFAGDVRVNARDSALVEVPIDFRFEGLGAALRSVTGRGTLEYRMTGTVQVVDPVRRAIPYRRSGNVSLQSGR